MALQSDFELDHAGERPFADDDIVKDNATRNRFPMPMHMRFQHESFIEHKVIGEDPLNVDRLFEKMRRSRLFDGAMAGATVTAMTGIEIALWDVAGKALGVPVYQLLGGKFRDTVRLYWDQSVYKKSGRPQEFPWHQDNGYTFVEPQQYLTFWIPLVDVDVENGCPWIAPGMHKLGTLAHWVRDDLTATTAQLGSAPRALDNYASYDCRGRNRVAGAKLAQDDDAQPAAADRVEALK